MAEWLEGLPGPLLMFYALGIGAGALLAVQLGPMPSQPTGAQPEAIAAEPPTSQAGGSGPDCHSAYSPCLPNLAGDALNCGDLASDQKPVRVLVPGVDPYRLDRDGDGWGCRAEPFGYFVPTITYGLVDVDLCGEPKVEILGIAARLRQQNLMQRGAASAYHDL